MDYTVEGTEEAGFIGGLVPEIAEALAWGQLVSKEAVEAELDLMLRTIRSFWQLEPDQVGLTIQALSARCTELCVHLHRVETNRHWKQVRTQQVERILAELDRQWKISSRMIEMRRQDLDLMK